MFKSQKGQALVMLLVFVAMSLVIIAGAVSVTIINTASSYSFSKSGVALSLAEAGVENSLLRLLRESGYSGETLSFDQGSVIVTVLGEGQKTILSEASSNGLKRKIQVVGNLENHRFTLTSWREVS